MKLLWLFLPLLLSACTRPGGGSSRLRLTLPGKLQTASALCYYVNVTGVGIAGKPAACGPTEGVGTGFLEPFASTELLVPKGLERTVELFGYVPANGEACSALGALSAAAFDHLYVLATKTGVDTSYEQTTVDLTATFPGVTQHYGVQVQLPAACYAGAPVLAGGPTPFRIASGAGLATGAGAKLKARIGTVPPQVTLTSAAGVKLRIK